MKKQYLSNLSLMVMFAVILVLNFTSILAFGGSEVFLVLMGFIIYLSNTKRIFEIEMSLVAHLLFLLMIINYVAYKESTTGLSMYVIIFGSLVIFSLSLLTTGLICSPFGSREVLGKSSAHKIELRQRVSGMVDSGIIAMTLGYMAVTIPSFLVLFKEAPPGKAPITFSSTIIFWFIFALFISHIRGKKVPRGYINSLVVKRERANPLIISKWLKYLIICTLLLGSLTEIVRGLWIPWVFSWLALVLIVNVTWRTWIYIFEEKEDDAEKLDPGLLPTIKDPVFFLKYIGSQGIVIIVYLIVLGLIWHFSLKEI